MKYLAILFIFLSTSCFAQFKMDTVRSGADTTSGFHMTKSPTLALALSAVVPGAGQIYLNQTWKVPIIYGVMGGFFYGALIQNHRYHYTIDSINNQLARQNSADTLLSRRYANAREFYRDDRDKWYIYLGLAYIANLLDAYIAANLYDFDVSDPTSSPLMIGLVPEGDRFGVRFQYRARLP